ncbi:DUF3040 domain-containing protein [Calidifontibacter sp. DB0510]|uniref:DUF3040 domain-containing protein n=1 Tax=Metallococcus carri TaxID=1656884 RepID=A0A967EBF0_9MICO|nr:DUF3040 domain-containing protein [Metallococcus carri]NHN56869.1 DUF3040 domain-containing protein [Metallococcus carri]NOP37614.1 DUF3040 domain-containing protein [Calidifontibacter sp. DB2511S]
MPLSEHEQRMLDEMEHALALEDPKFASQMRGQWADRHRGRLLLGAIGMLAGLGLVLGGVMSELIWLGVAGFVVMVAAAAWAFAPASRTTSLGTVQDDGTVLRATPRSRRAERTPGSFMQRLEARWERRRRDSLS